MAIHVSAAVLLLFQSSEKQEKKCRMTENRSIPLLSTGKEMVLTEQTVLMIKGYFLQNVSAAIILFNVKHLFKQANKFSASVAIINTYYRLSGEIWTVLSLKNCWLLMILRTTPEFFYPLPANILKTNSDQVGGFFSKREFTSAKVKCLIVWKWVLGTDTRTTPDLTQQHNQITTS